ncbi:mechanosensitive ion channel [Xenophilus arseniciresistens]|uniref:Mechanosensitive ion channel n=1 Tax=Xenophilus arseniciresistens TaxID=1283306 RepID=A0AAE3NAQ1_9BURK|nr:mechanosensitive ion channel domain-containing protein [Xenophilus arseniciresistens]MDA7417416.1 mechanosensitive ion channel [Xenophilus arseniciresistens]
MTLDTLTSHPWFNTAVAALIAVAVALLLHRLGALVVLRVTRPLLTVNALARAAQPATRILLPLLALQGVWQAAPDELRGLAALRHLNALALIFCFTWLAIRLINGFADAVLLRHSVDVADNMQARRIHTQTRVLARTAMVIVGILGTAMMLMTFPGARQVGASLLASAGVIGIVGGLAAKPVFSNLIAGLQIAITQPIRLDDVLIVEGEWGRVEEITGTYVVLRIWDERRLIIPLNHFIEKPFQNWTRASAQLLGSVFVHVDYATPLAPLRAEVERIVKAAPEWDGRFFNLVVTDASERTMQLRVLCTSANSGLSWDLRCKVREGLIDFMQREYPQHLPRLRIEADGADQPSPSMAPAAPVQAPPTATPSSPAP